MKLICDLLRIFRIELNLIKRQQPHRDHSLASDFRTSAGLRAGTPGRLALIATALLVYLSGGNPVSASPAKPSPPGKSTAPTIKAAANRMAAPVKLPKGSKLFMWKMTSAGGATVYFLGTIHVARPNFYPLADEIEKAFEKSKALLVEADISDKKHADSSDLHDKEYYKDAGDDITRHISPSTLRALQKYCAATDIPESRFMKMKPWYAGFSVGGLEAYRMGFRHENGIDLHFIEKAKKTGKRVIGLEKEHDDVLAGMDEDMQDKILRLSLIGVDLSRLDSLEQITKLWKAGDIPAMTEFLNKDVKKEKGLDKYHGRLLYDRNAAMADVIEPYLKGDGVYMVAVGSAHMVGDRNIIEILEKRGGYKVNQVLVGDEI